MSASTLWLIVKALLTVLPAIIEMVRTGQIKNQAQDELLVALNKKLDERIKRTQTVDIPDEAFDSDNRNNV